MCAFSLSYCSDEGQGAEAARLIVPTSFSLGDKKLLW